MKDTPRLLAEDELKLIRKTCREVLEKWGLTDAEVWLFGSCATGKHAVKADLDVFVDASTHPLSLRERTALGEELKAALEWELEMWVDLIIWDGRPLPGLPEDFTEYVKETGVRVC